MDHLLDTLSRESFLAETPLDIVEHLCVRGVCLVEDVAERKVCRAETVTEVLCKDPPTICVRC